MSALVEPPSAAPKRAGVALYVCTIALSAALLFTVEPMVSRMLLPLFGGSASVWSVALVFFQAALLVGYLYALLLTRLRSTLASVVAHIAVLAAGLFFLPVSVISAPSGGNPALDVAIALATAIGLPFVALSASAPLLQAWYTRSSLPGAANPYPLYAASNAGSLAALAAYPFVVEPAFGLRQQANWWLVAYVILIALVLLLGLMHRTHAQEAPRLMARVSGRQLLWWGSVAAIPSMGLVAVTAHISANIASAPFLWVLPLALYLTSFIIAFSSLSNALSNGIRMATVVLILIAIVAPRLTPLPFLAKGIAQLIAFFAVATSCHLLLVSRRPGNDRLAWFYVAMSAGGLVGGIFAAIIAPAVFSTIAEYPLFLALALFVAIPKWWNVALAIIVAWTAFAPVAKTVATLRSFYGVHTISEPGTGEYRVLSHGQEIHGAQRIHPKSQGALDPDLKPLTYYDEDGPLSEAIDAMRARRGGKDISIGVVGLGTGSMACLVEPGDELTYFEIDPKIVTIARQWFTFLNGCHPKADIKLGDARVTLQQKSDTFDLLVIDAFTGDAIPTHLLTREAIALYMARLKPGGMLVLHVSNNHLALNGAVVATARSLGLATRLYDEDRETTAPYIYSPTVVAVMANEADMATMFENDEWATPSPTGERPWTDDYANLFGALLAKLREQ